MGADSSASPAKDNVFPSDRSNTPLLPRPAGVHDIVSNSTLVATVQPPLPVVLVQRDNDSDFDKNGMGRATKEGYQTGICDCCTQPGGGQLCCYGCWCIPCLFGQNVENMGPVRWSGEQDAPSVIPCWAAALTFGVVSLPIISKYTAGLYMPWVLQVLLRRRIRRHYSIKGHSKGCRCSACDCCCCCECTDDDCADCCSAFWCLPCALCQDAREINIRAHVLCR